MAHQPTRLSADDLAQRSDDAHHVILDARPIAAYNGWRLRGEPRGGHVPGAKSVPLSWTRYMDWVEVLDEKGIRPDLPVTVYGYDEEDSTEMADRLEALGFDDVSIFSGFVDEWSADSDRPLHRLARYHQLVHPEWLQSLIAGEHPETYPGRGYVICHSHFDNIEDYGKGHIPGAIPLDTLALEDETSWNRRSPDEIRASLQALGIRHDTTVVVYGRFSFPRMQDAHPGKRAGHLGAIRCAAILLYAGVEDVRILNGGITPWETNGYPLSTEAVHPTPVDDFGAPIPGHPEYFIDTPEAKQLLASDDGELVSVRSWDEFIGLTSGYHYIEPTGRIPGAVFGNCGTDAYHMENYRNFDYTMREYQEVAASWAEAGLGPEKRVAFYCGTGWRGSEAFMNAYLMGWPRVAVYDGGWYEWSSDPANPVDSGETSIEAVSAGA